MNAISVASFDSSPLPNGLKIEENKLMALEARMIGSTSRNSISNSSFGFGTASVALPSNEEIIDSVSTI